MGFLAYEMYDGTYIKHGLPVICQIGDLTFNFNNAVANYRFDNCQYSKLKCSYAYPTDQVDDFLMDWKGVIMKICLFISEPISKFNVNSDLSAYTLINGTAYAPPFNTQAWDLLHHVTNYYEVHELTFDELTARIDAGWPRDADDIVEFYPNVGSVANIPTRDVVQVDQSSHHRLMAKDSFLYNQRLHHSNITTRLYEGYSPNFFAVDEHDSSTISDYRIIQDIYEYAGYTPVARGTAQDWALYTIFHLHTDEGDKTAYQMFNQFNGEFDVWEHATNPDLIFLNPILAYPDIRAYKVSIYVLDIGGGQYYKVGSYALKAHALQNISYYQQFNDPLEAENRPWPIVIDLSDPGDAVAFSVIQEEAGDITKHLVNDKNRVQVTGLNNPFFFPADNSYRVGAHGQMVLKTIAMGEAVSTGQFGQFPLYVFTEQGIFTMEVGSGDVLYRSIHPLNSHVVNNLGSIINVGHAVVYATANGLYAITGSQVKDISMNGKGRLDNPILNLNDSSIPMCLLK